MAKNEDDIVRCVRCNALPKMQQFDDGWYIIHECQQFRPRGVMGYQTPRAAREAWREMNEDGK